LTLGESWTLPFDLVCSTFDHWTCHKTWSGHLICKMV
jgi:hypothetical protein